MTDEQLRQDIHEAQKIPIDWKGSFENLSSLADQCNITLSMIDYFSRYRETERECKSRAISTKALRKKWEHDFEANKENYPGDMFFYPGEFMLLSGEKYYFSNADVRPYFLKIISPGGIKCGEEVRLADARFYALTFKKIFYLLSQDENPSLLIIPRLVEIFFNIWNIKNDMLHTLEDQERQRERNRRNASTRTPAKIEDCKKHDLYPQLEQMIKSYRETPKELREINKLVGEIIGTKNRVTVKRYRFLFFQKIQTR